MSWRDKARPIIATVIAKYGSDYHADPWKHGIWGCRRGCRCQWKGFVLSKDGISIGTVPHETDAWRKCHARECGGELVQILEREKQ